MVLDTVSRKSGSANPNWRGGMMQACAKCGVEVWVKPSKAARCKTHFCNASCRSVWFSENTRGEAGSNWKGGKVDVACGHCGTQFLALRAEFNRGRAKFCSRTCHHSESGGDKSSHWKGGIKAQRTRHYEKHKNELAFRLRRRLSRAMRRCLISGKGGRTLKSMLGYSLDDLLARLNDTMPTGYDWEDFSNGTLHIDHIRPLSSFSFESPDDPQFHACWALSNLQLLPAMENWKKNDRLDWPLAVTPPIHDAAPTALI